MTTLEERAPLAFRTPTERDEIADLLAKAERISAELADIYRQAPARKLHGTCSVSAAEDLRALSAAATPGPT